jgi:hypothetical protein
MLIPDCYFLTSDLNTHLPFSREYKGCIAA